MQRTFLLGMGAQKAATTWLHHYICSSGRSAVRPSVDKELNIFNNQRRGYPDLDTKKSIFRGLGGRHFKTWKFQKFPASYFKWLDENVEAGLIFPDISPAYCMLNADHISYIRQKFNEMGFDFKIVFVMRDPVDRCISAFNMHYGRANVNMSLYGIDKKNFGFEENFVRYFCSHGCSIFSDYISTYENIKKSGSIDSSLIIGYRDIFKPNGFNNLNDFLSLEPRFSAVHEIIYGGSDKKDPSVVVQEQCQESFRNIYDFFREELPNVYNSW